jgi:leucyl aminopeptidase
MNTINNLKQTIKVACLLTSSLFLINCSGNEERTVVNKTLIDNPEAFAAKHGIDEIREDQDFYVISTTSREQREAVQEEVSHLAHEAKKCGGFTQSTEEEIIEISEVLKEQNILNNSFDVRQLQAPVSNELITQINSTLTTENVKASVDLLVSQGTRSAKSRTPNKPIEAFMNHINKTLEGGKLNYTMDRIEHSSTNQDSIRVRIVGTEKPEAILVLGGHIDSTTGWFGGDEAPGADDNASGSSVILETLRALVFSDFKPAKTLEFFWYAGEENGLLGSKEIARSYRDAEKNVEAVMQLDMVMFPGNGDVIGLTTDYTNVELTKITEDLTTLYVGSPVARFKCGYGCSDHASWHNNGFKTVFPFESTFDKSNKNIHTKRDVIDSRSSIEHALKFSKIAVAFLVEMSGR